MKLEALQYGQENPFQLYSSASLVVAETATGVGPLFATSLKGFAGPEPFLRPTIRPNQPLRALVGGKANGAGRELRIEDGAAGFASGARAAWTAFSTC